MSDANIAATRRRERNFFMLILLLKMCIYILQAKYGKVKQRGLKSSAAAPFCALREQRNTASVTQVSQRNQKKMPDWRLMRGPLYDRMTPL
jgi:hypothetical protein